jgi:hypothetical protein
VDILRPHQPCDKATVVSAKPRRDALEREMDRRTFPKHIGGAALIPIFADQEVRGWRFGVWTIIERMNFAGAKGYYWCRCDCGAERVVSLNHLLSVDALSCDHVRVRGFFPVDSDALICRNCEAHRRFFFNGDGFRIWRCGNCEEADIRAYLRREYGPVTSVQFMANMGRR